MSDNSPWTDNRARQSSLLEDDEALRTRGRSGEAVTGSSEFVDDRAGGGADRGEQADLFTEREEMGGQQSLGGGTATRTSENAMLEEEIDADRGPIDLEVQEPIGTPEVEALSVEAFAMEAEEGSPTFDEDTGHLDPTPGFEVYGPTSRRPLPPEETDRGFSHETAENVVKAGYADPETGEVDLGPETETIEFGSRPAANKALDELPEEAVVDPDRRTKTVEVKSYALADSKLDRISGMAADSKAYEEEKVGQAELSRRERKEIDFTATSIPHARSAKAIMLDAGVDDWTAFYDPTLTVDEHRELADRAARDERGRRMDSEESVVEKEARAHRRAAGELEQHAIAGAEAGEEEAIETLVELGWSPDDARGLAEAADTDRERAAILDVAISRAVSNGRFTRQPPAKAPGAPSKYRQPTSGRFLGNAIDRSPGIGRDPADGQFVSKGRF